MMDVQSRVFFGQSPFIRLIFPLMLGIATSLFADLPSWFEILFFTGLLLSFFLILIWYRRFLSTKRWRFGVPVFVSFFCFGYLLVEERDVRNSQIYFGNFTETCILGEVLEKPEEKNRAHKTILEVRGVGDGSNFKPAKGKLLLYLQKDTLNILLDPGQVIMVKPWINEIPPPANPGQFDYKGYMALQGIYLQSYVKKEEWKFVSREGNWRTLLFRIRNGLVQTFAKYPFGSEEYAVLCALVLGQKQYLDEELVRAYSSTGAMHVLAVSGLHVGIFYLVVQGLLKLFKVSRKRKIFRLLVVLSALWLYAALTGFSASVMRATTMFSFITIGVNINRNANIYNNLAASAFILLLIKPSFLAEVGFQLSYLAVIGIVYLQPRIYRLWEAPNFWVDKIWALTAVSISAQIATFPLGLLYFHQFPNYFFISNLIVIPAAMIILYGGLLLLSISFIDAISQPFAVGLNYFISKLNTSLRFLEQLPQSLITGISISVMETFLLYSLMVFLVAFLVRPGQMKLLLTASFLFLFMGIQAWEGVQQGRQQKLVVYDIAGQSAINVIYGRKHLFITTPEFYAMENQMLFNIKNAWYQMGLEEEIFSPIDRDTITSVGSAILWKRPWLFFGNERLLIVDEKYPKVPALGENGFSVLLRLNPRVRLSELKEKGAQSILADNSNHTWAMNAWQKEADSLGIDFQTLRNNSAFIKDWK